MNTLSYLKSKSTKRKGQIAALPAMVVLLVLSGLIIMIGGHIWSVVDDTVQTVNTTPNDVDTQIENISGAIGEGLETFGDFFPVIVVMVVLGIMITLFIGRGGMMGGVGGGL